MEQRFGPQGWRPLTGKLVIGVELWTVDVNGL